MKSKYWMAAGLLLCASTAADAGPRPLLVDRLLNTGGVFLNPLLAPVFRISGPIASNIVATYSPIGFTVITRLTAPLRGPIGAGGRLPGLR
ncbi:MAG: hypothetical protein ACT4QA_03325 [Panacagrimonas sp.]